MLSVTLYVIGAVLLLGAALAAVSGLFVLLLPQLLIGGVLLIVGLAIERWRYKPVGKTRPDSRWTDTGERFVDPESGAMVAVYFDPADGSRHYIDAGRA
jgi:predicted membrane channel-forming protein YqfA (hemolysin III family)